MARILVIDDDPDILLIIDHTLTKAGHHVVASSDPSMVAALALEHHVDAVILDVMMPDISGFDALRTLRRQPQTGGVPILFLSARSESEDRVRGLREGADDYMVKPFDLEELVLRIERLVVPRTPAAPVPSSNLARTLNEGRVVGQIYLGRYQALEVIGEGAMGLVFRGWDPRLKRPVALKTLRLEGLVGAADRDQKIGRLLEEACTTARVNHPNIVSIYDADAGPEIAYMAMEFVDGTTLARYVNEHGRRPPGQAVLLALGIARGLEAAHENRIVHHDVKPGNVLLGRDGSIKVSDFGVAHLVHSLVRPRDKVFGTVGYLPPETLQGEGYDERGDLFALGAILYECLTARRAFGGPSLPLRIYKTVAEEVEPIRDLVPDVPADLERLVLELLRKDPDRRVASAAEVVKSLEAMTDRDLRFEPEIAEPSVRATSEPAGLASTVLTLADVTRALKAAT
jgi:serine/threonine-protein kinase